MSTVPADCRALGLAASAVQRHPPRPPPPRLPAPPAGLPGAARAGCLGHELCAGLPAFGEHDVHSAVVAAERRGGAGGRAARVGRAGLRSAAAVGHVLLWHRAPGQRPGSAGDAHTPAHAQRAAAATGGGGRRGCRGRHRPCRRWRCRGRGAAYGRQQGAAPLCQHRGGSRGPGARCCHPVRAAACDAAPVAPPPGPDLPHPQPPIRCGSGAAQHAGTCSFLHTAGPGLRSRLQLGTYQGWCTQPAGSLSPASLAPHASAPKPR